MKKNLLLIAFVFTAVLANAQCQAHFNYSESALTVTFADSSYGTTTPANWSWNFGDGNTSSMQSPSHTYVQAGTYIVCLTVYTPFSNCQSTYCDSIVVGNPGNCYAGYTFVVDTINPNQVDFTDTSSGGVVTWQWDFGDAGTSTSQHPTYIYANTGMYAVCLTTIDSNGCSATHCDTVTVGSMGNCSSNFSYSVDFVDQNMVHFYDSSSASVYTVWNFGNSIVDSTQNPTHIFQGPGTYTVCLTIGDSSGCESTSCQQVVVGPVSCSANFSFAPDTVDLQTIHFTDLTLGNTTGWIWDFGDGDSVYTMHASHTYATNGTYNVCLTVFDSASNCVDTHCKTVEISSCYASYTYVADSIDPYTVHLFDNSLGNPTSWHWDFEDGTTSNLQNPVHTYPFDAWHWVCLTTTNSNTNCTNTYCSFVYAGSPSNCYEYWELTPDSADALTIHFQEYSWGAPPSDFFWDFGDGDTSNLQNPTHTYDTAGVYFVCCTISDSAGNCSFSDCYYLNVGNYSNCPATFTYTAVSGSMASFSYTGSGNPSSYLWDFGAWGTSTQPNPANDFQAPGTYYVCLTISDSSCTNTICDSVEIYAMGQEEMLLEDSFSIYPNPANNNFYIRSNTQNAGVVTLSIFNPLGELVEQRVVKNSTEMVDLSDKASGLYSIKIQNQKSVVHKKVMIVK